MPSDNTLVMAVCISAVLTAIWGYVEMLRGEKARRELAKLRNELVDVNLGRWFTHSGNGHKIFMLTLSTPGIPYPEDTRGLQGGLDARALQGDADAMRGDRG